MNAANARTVLEGALAQRRVAEGRYRDQSVAPARQLASQSHMDDIQLSVLCAIAARRDNENAQVDLARRRLASVCIELAWLRAKNSNCSGA